MFCLLVKHYLKVHFKELFKSFNHKHDLLYFNNMVCYFWNSQIKLEWVSVEKVVPRLMRSC